MSDEEMQELQEQNNKLKSMKQTCQQELAKCKQLGQTHEHEIDTLLKFNEKLIGIIESEFNASSKSKISDLQPISEAIEKEPDPGLGIRMHNKLMKSMANTPTHFITNQLENFELDQNRDKRVAGSSFDPTRVIEKERALSRNGPTPKLDEVFEKNNKKEQISINLSQSGKNNSSVIYHRSGIAQTQSNGNLHDRSFGISREDFENELLALKNLTKECKEFQLNSPGYLQTCEVMQVDLAQIMQNARRLAQTGKTTIKNKQFKLKNLSTEIKAFKPTNQLMRIMRSLRVIPQTEILLHQRIISKFA